MAPVVVLEVMMVVAWMRSDHRGSSPSFLGLRERIARVLSVEDEEKEKESRDFEGRWREIFGIWYREEGKVGNLSLPTASYSER